VTANALSEEGTTLADTAWVLTTNDSITVGGAAGTAMTFTQFAGVGTSYLYSYGKRITRLFFRWK
jgi:hypothetical protein